MTWPNFARYSDKDDMCAICLEVSTCHLRFQHQTLCLTLAFVIFEKTTKNGMDKHDAKRTCELACPGVNPGAAGHRFHKKCINTWGKCHNTCPLCKAKIVLK